MTYAFRVRSQAGTQPIDEKHASLIQAWSGIAGEGDWSFTQKVERPYVTGGSSITGRSLRPFRDKNTHLYVQYQLREPELASRADSLEIDFAPSPARYQSLLVDLIPMILRVWKPFLITLGDSRFNEREIGPDGVVEVSGPRACGGFLYPVFFMDEPTLRAMVGKGVASAAERLSKVAETVRVDAGGLLVIGSSSILSFQEALDLTRSMEGALRGADLWRILRKVFGVRSGHR